MTARKFNGNLHTACKASKIPLILTILSFSLPGCGGGEKVPVEVEPRTLLKSFSDNSGIGRQKDSSATFHVFIDNIQQWQANDDTNSESLNFDDSSDSLVNQHMYAAEQHGVRNFEGVDWESSTFIDYDSLVSVSLLYLPSDNTNFPSIIVTDGEPASNIPIGSVNYHGQTIISTKINGQTGIGVFNMNVDFENGTGTINGNTSGIMHFQLQGSFDVDTGNATFLSDNLTLAIRSGTEVLNSASASLYGSFHGDGVTGVSGIYHNNAETPVVLGSIIGASQNLR